MVGESLDSSALASIAVPVVTANTVALTVSGSVFKATAQELSDFVGENLTGLSLTATGIDDPILFSDLVGADPAVLLLDNRDSGLPLLKARVGGVTGVWLADVNGFANLLIGDETALINWGGFSDDTAAVMVARDEAVDGAGAVQFEIVHFHNGIIDKQADIAFRCASNSGTAVSIDLEYTTDQSIWDHLVLGNGTSGPYVAMSAATGGHAEQKVLGRRVIDAGLAGSAAASYDATTRTLINSLRSVVLTHGLGSAS